MLLINLLFEKWDHHQFQSCTLPRVTFLNNVLNVQRHRWLQLLGLFKRMIFEKKDFAIWLLLHRDDGVILLRVNERLQIVVLQVGFEFFIEVQDSFVRVSDLEILVDIPWRPSFPWESVSLSVDLLLQKKSSSLEMSVDDFLKTTRYLTIKNLEMCPQFCFGDCIWCLQLGTGLRELHLADPNHCFCPTTCTWRHFTSKYRSSTPKIECNFERKTFNYIYLGSGMSPIVRSRPSTN